MFFSFLSTTFLQDLDTAERNVSIKSLKSHVPDGEKGSFFFVVTFAMLKPLSRWFTIQLLLFHSTSSGHIARFMRHHWDLKSSLSPRKRTEGYFAAHNNSKVSKMTTWGRKHFFAFQIWHRKLFEQNWATKNAEHSSKFTGYSAALFVFLTSTSLVFILIQVEVKCNNFTSGQLICHVAAIHHLSHSSSAVGSCSSNQSGQNYWRLEIVSIWGSFHADSLCCLHFIVLPLQA